MNGQTGLMSIRGCPVAKRLEAVPPFVTNSYAFGTIPSPRRDAARFAMTALQHRTPQPIKRSLTFTVLADFRGLIHSAAVATAQSFSGTRQTDDFFLAAFAPDSDHCRLLARPRRACLGMGNQFDDGALSDSQSNHALCVKLGHIRLQCFGRGYDTIRMRCEQWHCLSPFQCRPAGRLRSPAKRMPRHDMRDAFAGQLGYVARRRHRPHQQQPISRHVIPVPVMQRDRH